MRAHLGDRVDIFLVRLHEALHRLLVARLRGVDELGWHLLVAEARIFGIIAALWLTLRYPGALWSAHLSERNSSSARLSVSGLANLSAGDARGVSSRRRRSCHRSSLHASAAPAQFCARCAHDGGVALLGRDLHSHRRLHPPSAARRRVQGRRRRRGGLRGRVHPRPARRGPRAQVPPEVEGLVLRLLSPE